MIRLASARGGTTAFFVLSTLLATLLATGCSTLRKGAREDLVEVKAVLDAQVAAWNRGDLDAFAKTYEKSPRLVFRGPSELTTGWDAFVARFRRAYPTKEAMGELRFAALEFDDLGHDTILAHGRWELNRANDVPMGHFAIVLRRLEEGWRIVMDYSNSSSPTTD